MNVAELLISIVQRLGTDSVFSLTGGMAMHVNRAVDASGLKAIYCNHEQACVAAADGYAKMHEYQVPGFAVVTSGPGVTNIMTSLASAHHDSVPLVVVAGQVKRADLNRFAVRSYGAQEVPSLEMVRPIVKDTLRYDPATIDDRRLAEFFAEALSGRKGPVFVEIPLDVQPLQVPSATDRLDRLVLDIRALAAKRAPLDLSHREIIRASAARSERPVVVVGNGVRIAGVPRERIRALVDRLGAPALFTWPSADLLDSGHPLCFGRPGGLAATHSNNIIQKADFILFLGARLDLLTTGFNPALFGKRAFRVVVDVDANELGKLSHLPDACLVNADVESVVGWLERQTDLDLRRPQWTQRCETLRRDDAALETRSFGDTAALNARNMARAFSEKLTGTTIVATGSGYAIEGFARFWEPTRGNHLIYAGHCLGSMGMGLPAAIGAAAAKLGPVICLEGDGGLMLNLQELLTLQANRDLKLCIGIMNNDGYLSISRSQARAFGAQFGASATSGLGSADFRALAQCFGLEYVRVESREELRRLLDSIASGRSRIMFDMLMSDDDYRGPAIVTRFRDDGSPYSSDIEDVSWRPAPTVSP